MYHISRNISIKNITKAMYHKFFICAYTQVRPEADYLFQSLCKTFVIPTSNLKTTLTVNKRPVYHPAKQ